MSATGGSAWVTGGSNGGGGPIHDAGIVFCAAIYAFLLDLCAGDLPQTSRRSMQTQKNEESTSLQRRQVGPSLGVPAFLCEDAESCRKDKSNLFEVARATSKKDQICFGSSAVLCLHR